MSTHRCPVHGCPEEVSAEMLMCRTHWRQVPQGVRDRVYGCWRARQRNQPGAVADHLQAIEDATAAVEGREPERLFA